MRRRFLASLATFVSAFTLLFSGLPVRGDKIDLTPHTRVARTSRVTIKVEAGGQMKTPPDETGEKEPQALPTSVVGDLLFDQQLQPGGKRAFRHYEQAAAVIKIGETGSRRELPEAKRIFLVGAEKGRPLFVSPTGPLQRKQLDLIDTMGDPLTLDLLLPEEPISADEAWEISDAAAAAFTGMDDVGVNTISCVVEKQSKRYAQLRMAGSVHGTVDGAAAQLELRAAMLFDHSVRQISKVNLAVKEKRELGVATPGLDVVAKLRISIKPIAQSPSLTEAITGQLPPWDALAPRTLSYESPRLGVSLEHDPAWYVTGENRTSTTLRRVASDKLVAQCTITRLAPKPANQTTSLAEFQKDVRYILGEKFERFIADSQWTNSQGARCLTVVSRGKVGEVAIEWHHHLVAEPTGERVSVAVTIEQDDLGQLASADRALVDRIALSEPDVSSSETTASNEITPIPSNGNRPIATQAQSKRTQRSTSQSARMARRRSPHKTRPSSAPGTRRR